MREVTQRRRRAWAAVVVALAALPALSYGMLVLWNRGFRVGVIGGLVVAAVLSHRTMKRAMERR